MHESEPAEPKGYDLPMIRDFLIQLRCELRAALREMTGPADVDEELVQELTPLVQKYDSTLMFVDAIDAQDESQGRVQTAARELRARQALLRQEQLERLEVLEGLFNQAFDAGSYSLANQGQPVRSWTVEEILGNLP